MQLPLVVKHRAVCCASQGRLHCATSPLTAASWPRFAPLHASSLHEVPEKMQMQFHPFWCPPRQGEHAGKHILPLGIKHPAGMQAQHEEAEITCHGLFTRSLIQSCKLARKPRPQQSGLQGVKSLFTTCTLAPGKVLSTCLAGHPEAGTRGSSAGGGSCVACLSSKAQRSTERMWFLPWHRLSQRF